MSLSQFYLYICKGFILLYCFFFFLYLFITSNHHASHFILASDPLWIPHPPYTSSVTLVSYWSPVRHCSSLSSPLSFLTLLLCVWEVFQLSLHYHLSVSSAYALQVTLLLPSFILYLIVCASPPHPLSFFTNLLPVIRPGGGVLGLVGFFQQKNCPI